MKSILLAVVLFGSACTAVIAQTAPARNPSAAENAKADSSIREAIMAQADAWNRADVDAFMQRYEQVRGKTVDEERLHFFSGFFHLRTLICCNIVATRVQQGRSSEIVALNIDYEYLPKVMQICVDATLD